MIKSLKAIIKHFTTRQQRKYLKGLFPHILFTIKLKHKLINSNNCVIKVFERSHKNVFNGYYDINPLKNNKLLVHSCNNSDKTDKDSIELGWFNINTKKYHKITNTHAWCWQQGSRLRWSKRNDIIIYNDCINRNYCSIFYDIETNKIIKKIDYALYDITKDEKYGLSLNFSRLQRLRPGYGYNMVDDNTEYLNAPNNDGIFLIDIEKNTSKLIIKLSDLAKLNDIEEKYQHYINHISISPSGKKFIFFHIYAKEKKWKTQLISANIDGTQLKVLENEDLVSHYTWKSDDEVLITGVDKKNNCFYRLYEITGKYMKDITDNYLKKDGHPTFVSESMFITDTYPHNNYQTVFLHDISTKKDIDIIKLYSDQRLVDECRCDLHPKIDKKNDLIFIDTTYKKGKRTIIMIRGVISEQKRKKTC